MKINGSRLLRGILEVGGLAILVLVIVVVFGQVNAGRPSSTPAGMELTLPLAVSPTVGASVYISREVVVTPRGSAPGEVGIQEVPGGPAGPKSFAVRPDGEVYILDTVNHRINRYAGQGTFLSSVVYQPSIFGCDLAVASDGALYVLDGSDFWTVRRYEPDGTPSLVYKHPMRIQISHIGLVAANLLAESRGIGADMVITLGNAQREFSPNEQVRTKRDGLLYRAGTFTGRLVRSATGKGGYVERVLADGKMLRLDLTVDGFVAATPGFDVDVAGNIYVVVQVDRNGRGDIDERVLRYSPAGKLLDNVDIDDRYYAVPSRAVLVDERGDIYQLLPAKDRTVIKKWERR
ncbi:MAG: hypothetical protein M1136_00780 [Chloroflexi bacterium]|nr:hypothetical protein [Chloroflexota bacterium]